MSEHVYSTTGRYEITWNDHTHVVTIWDRRKGGIRVNTFTMEPSLSEVAQMISDEQGEVGPLSADEISFLINMTAAIDTIIDHAAYDLERFGHIGVSG